MKATIDEIRSRGIDTPILIGGGIVDDKTVEYSGATARCQSPMDDVIYAKKFLGVG
jgi:methanogenic corrinoid protein MtbC1